MDNSLDSALISRVWSRVSGESETEISLPDAIKLSYNTVACFSQLLKSSRFSRECLSRCLCEKRRELSFLQSAHFLQKGDTVPLEKVYVSFTSVPDSLRECYSSEKRMASLLTSLSRSCGGEKEKERFVRLSEKAAKRAECISRLIETFMRHQDKNCFPKALGSSSARR